MRGVKMRRRRRRRRRRRMTKLAKTPDHNQNTLSGGFEKKHWIRFTNSDELPR